MLLSKLKKAMIYNITGCSYFVLESHKTDDYEKSSRRFLFFIPVGWDNTAVWFVAAEIKTKAGCVLR